MSKGSCFVIANARMCCDAGPKIAIGNPEVEALAGEVWFLKTCLPPLMIMCGVVLIWCFFLFLKSVVNPMEPCGLACLVADFHESAGSYAVLFVLVHKSLVFWTPPPLLPLRDAPP